MNTLPAPLRQKLLVQSTEPFSVVVAFDSAAALNHAKQLCSHLLDQLNHTVDIQCSWCQFDQLPDERFAREAVEVTALADPIVVASARATDPPPVVQAWVGKYLASRTARDPALAG